MPFRSRAQSRWGNSPAGLRALGGKDKIDEWNASTDLGSLPEKAEGMISKALKRKPAVAGVLGKRFQPK